MKKQIVPVDLVTGDLTTLIILRSSGIFYTAQCGGIGCTHPSAEGFAIAVGEFAQDFDDCSFGCHYISDADNGEARQLLGEAFDKYCLEKCDGWRWNIRFDFDRVAEVQEGWLPVIVNGVIDEFYDFAFQNAKGFIHNGNCD